MANKKQIGLLFGVEGGNSLDGQSGKRISQQIMAIAHNISNKQKPAITFKVDEKRTTNQIQSQLNKIAQGLTIKIGGNTNVTQGAQKQVRDLTRQVTNARIKLMSMGGGADRRKYENTGIKSIEDTYQAYIKLVDLVKKADEILALDPNNVKKQQAFIEVVKRVSDVQKALKTEFNNSTAMDKQALSYNKVIARITEYQAKFKDTLKNTPQLAAQLEELNQQLAGGTFKGTESDAQNRFVKLTNQIRAAGGEAETLGQKIRRIFGEKLGYGIIASAAMMARQAVRQVYTNVVELDKAVVDLQIATGKTRKEVKELVNTYSELGRELGATTSEVAQASDSWLRQGYSIEQVNELTRNSIMLAKLGQMESADATTALTSALRGYELQAEDVGSVTDKLVAVDMTAAVTAGKKIA